MKKLYLVLGMHRSGTSLMANLINSFGINVGNENELYGADEHNQKGYYEYGEIVRIHDKMLKEMGQSWYLLKKIPAEEKVRVYNKYKYELLSIMKNIFEKNDTFCIKDPRMCLFLMLWKEIVQELKVETYCIVTYRNPIAVAKSLKKRDMMDEEYALDLWKYYNLNIIINKISDKYFFVNYDEVIEEKADINKLYTFITGKNENIQQTVIDKSLRHNKKPEQKKSIFDNDVKVILDILEKIKKESCIDIDNTRLFNMQEGLLDIYVEIDNNRVLSEDALIDLKENNIYVYGCGKCGYKVNEYLKKNNIHNFGFIDRDKKKQGTLYCEKKVLSFEEIMKIDKDNTDYVIIIAIESKETVDDVSRMLMWLDNCKIISADRLCVS